MGLFSFFSRKSPANAVSPPVRKPVRGFQEGYMAAIQEGQVGYRAGQIYRENYDWNPRAQTPTSMLRLTGKLLRQRAYNLVDENPAASSAVNAYLANVVECGIDAYRDEAWEGEWERWCGVSPHAEPDCDLARRQTMPEQTRTFLRELIVAGGVLTHWVDVPRKSQRVPIAIQFKGEDWFNTDLDTWGPMARNQKTKNRVIQGIEIDQATGRHVAYHVYTHHPDDNEFDPTSTMRISAENARYAALPEKLGQFRGVSKLRSAILWLYSLGYYFDNELAASNLKSSWGYILCQGPESAFGTDSLVSGESPLTDLNGNPITEHQRAMVWKGGPESQIKTIGPNVPQADSIPWIELIQQSISIGLDLSWEEVFRVYSKGSFSSGRMARSQDKKRHQFLQWFVINHFLAPTMKRWDKAAVGAFLPGLPDPDTFNATQDEIYATHDWVPPTWESPNPREDATANDIQIKNRTKARSECMRERGRRPSQVRRAIKEEIDEMRADGTLPPDEAAADVTDMAPPESLNQSPADQPGGQQ